MPEFEECVVGLTVSTEPTLVYDYEKIITQLESEGLTNDEAVEHFEFNIAGGYVGPRTPIFLNRYIPPAAPAGERPLSAYQKD